MDIAEHISRVTRIGGANVALDFDGQTVSWTALGDAITTLDGLLGAANLGRDSLIALLGRNRLEQLSGFIATMGSGRGLLLVNAVRPTGLVAGEIRDLKPSCILGAHGDLTPEVMEAARNCGSLVLALSVADGKVTFGQLTERGDGPFRQRQPGTLIEIQTSGTTGAPKRIPVAERTVTASLRDGVRTAAGAVEQTELTVKSSPTLMFGPLVHTSGTFNTLMSVFEARPIVLFEKFEVDKFLRALVRYRPKFLPLPPGTIRMLLDSQATREDFSSVIAVRAGTAPLAVETQIAFEETFGVPVLTTYGATEFMGVATSWTLEDHRRYGKEKRGSVGRASKGVHIRIVDPDSGTVLGTDETGVLEAKLDRIDGGKDWIRTSDLGRIDADGFLYILGRTDDAINRGGFKVMAGKVADVMRQFPGIFDVLVLGRPDPRLGEVPIAIVEPYPGASIDGSALKGFVRSQLSPYEVPTQAVIVEHLPRTVSDKVSRPDVKRLLDGLEAGEAVSVIATIPFSGSH